MYFVTFMDMAACPKCLIASFRHEVATKALRGQRRPRPLRTCWVPLNTDSIARCERGETRGRRKPREDNNPTNETGLRFRDRGVHRGFVDFPVSPEDVFRQAQRRHRARRARCRQRPKQLRYSQGDRHDESEGHDRVRRGRRLRRLHRRWWRPRNSRTAANVPGESTRTTFRRVTTTVRRSRPITRPSTAPSLRVFLCDTGAPPIGLNRREPGQRACWCSATPPGRSTTKPCFQRFHSVGGPR
jgi:hypothetical protein